MQASLIVLGVLVAVVLVARIFIINKMKSTPLVDNHEKILTLTDKNFQQQLSNKIVLVDFWASWCAPCRMMAPILNEVATELKENSYVGKVDIEQYQILAQKFKVRNIPTLILLKNGVEVNRFVGVKNKDFLLNHINKVR